MEIGIECWAIVDSEVRGTTLQNLIVDSEVRGTTLQKLIVDMTKAKSLVHDSFPRAAGVKQI